MGSDGYTGAKRRVKEEGEGFYGQMEEEMEDLILGSEGLPELNIFSLPPV